MMGVSFGASYDENYLFVVTSNGMAALIKTTGEETEILSDFTPVLDWNKDGANRLGVSVSGSSITALVNHDTVARYESGYVSGDVILVVSGVSSGEFIVEFDNFVIQPN
jgi:hypothetical protein